MNTNIPTGYKKCACCDGCGEVVVGEIPAVFYYADGTGSPAEDITETCEECGGDGYVVAESDEDFDESDEDFDGSDEDFDDEPSDSMDGDAESALASAGFGTDEDYRSFDDSYDD